MESTGGFTGTGPVLSSPGWNISISVFLVIKGLVMLREGKGCPTGIGPRLQSAQAVVSKEIVWELPDLFFIFVEDLGRSAVIVAFQQRQPKEIVNVRDGRIQRDGLLEFFNRFGLVRRFPVGPAKHKVPDRPITIVAEHLLECSFRLGLFLQVEISQAQK